MGEIIDEITEWIEELYSEIKALPSDVKGLIDRVHDRWEKFKTDIEEEVAIERIKMDEADKIKKEKKQVIKQQKVIVIRQDKLIALLLVALIIIELLQLALLVTVTLAGSSFIEPVNRFIYRASYFLGECDDVNCESRILGFIGSLPYPGSVIELTPYEVSDYLVNASDAS